MKCPQCGADNAPSANFCYRCRTPLARPTPPPAAPPSPAYQPPPPAYQPSPPAYQPPPSPYGPVSPPLVPTGAGTVTAEGMVRLLPAERVVTRLEAGASALYLTSQRVVLAFKGYLAIARLEDVDSVNVRATRLPWIVGLMGLLLLAAGLYAVFQELTQTTIWGEREVPVAGLILTAIGAAIVALYWLWKRRALILTVGGLPAMAVSFWTFSEQKAAEVLAFVDAFCQARADLEQP